MMTIVQACYEKTSPTYQATVADNTLVPIPAASLATLKLTLYDLTSGNIVNGRNAQNVLNANGGTVDSAGRFTMQFDPPDTTLVDQKNRQETRVALFEFTWGSPAKTGRYEFRFIVRNLGKVT